MAKKREGNITLSKKPSIDEWSKQKRHFKFVDTDGRLFVCNFDKSICFGKEQPEFAPYTRFMIKKSSYENQLPVIVKYINYFINVYDDDRELVAAYLKIKYMVDKMRAYSEENMNAYIDFVYNVLFQPSIVDKISMCVEDNYTDDIEGQSSDIKKKYAKNEKKHLESLEFTNQHIKILHKISLAIKIMSPVLFHYLAINGVKLEKDSMVIFKFYKRLFELFSEGTNMYNKLYVYVKTKVGESNSNNSPIFEQREIIGIDLYNVIEQFVKKVIISENMVKYQFNENIIGFHKVVIKFQLKYFLKDSYAKNLTEVTNTKSSEGLSGSDKMLMNLSKVNEGETIIADINIEETIKKIMRDHDIVITEDELDFYRKNHHPDNVQIQLVNTFWAKLFGSYRDLNLLSRTQYLKLALILKKRLLAMYAYENIAEDGRYQCILPFILTGNISGKVNARVIRNNKFMNKVQDNYLYQDLVQNKFANIEAIHPQYLITQLSSFINTQFTYVSYEHPDLLGETIMYDDDKICDELLFFYRLI